MVGTCTQTITENDVRQGITDAFRTYGESVCAPTLYSLTDAQQEFVSAMAEGHPRASSVNDIAQRLGKTPAWVNKYRSSLIRAQVIGPAGRGKVAYAIPRFGEWMRKHEGLE